MSASHTNISKGDKPWDNWEEVFLSEIAATKREWEHANMIILNTQLMRRKSLNLRAKSKLELLEFAIRQQKKKDLGPLYAFDNDAPEVSDRLAEKSIDYLNRFRKFCRDQLEQGPKLLAQISGELNTNKKPREYLVFQCGYLIGWHNQLRESLEAIIKSEDQHQIPDPIKQPSAKTRIFKRVIQEAFEKYRNESPKGNITEFKGWLLGNSGDLLGIKIEEVDGMDSDKVRIELQYEGRIYEITRTWRTTRGMCGK